MILLLTSTFDLTTNDIIDWLLLYKNTFKVINENTKITLSLADINRNEIILKVDNEQINLKDIKAVWYRRLKLKLKSHIIAESEDKKLGYHINHFLELENDVLNELIDEYIQENVRTIGSNTSFYINKILQLKKAKEIGLNIPDTVILTNTKYLPNLKQNKIISKGIYESFHLNDDELFCYSGTELVDDNFNNAIIGMEEFAPSLFQFYIEKYIEIRVFYLKKKLYSMAIFSQANDKTKIDYRNYDFKKMNRMVPFKLPAEIVKKIQHLMLSFSLDCGSIDLILSKDLIYYFLEINPVGQFNFLSSLCNYNLEQKIAKYLVYDD